jgi:hypothetical protein
LPTVEGMNNIDSVKVFNESYVNQFLFTQDEVVKNSFEIFIKTPEYDQKMEEIDAIVSGIKDTFRGNEKLEQVTQDLTELSVSFGKTTSCSHGSGKITKILNGLVGITREKSLLKCLMTVLITLLHQQKKKKPSVPALYGRSIHAPQK